MWANSPSSVELSRGESLRERCYVGVVLFITAIAYLGTLRYELVYDDDPQVLHNPFVKSWEYVPQYFVSSVWKQQFPLLPGNYYRPLFLLWIRVNYAIFGTREIGWHAAAVLLHLLVTWLVYRLVLRLTGNFTTAWLSALIFGLHPIHHEVVAWFSGTTESLYAAIFLAAFLAYLNSVERSKPVWMAVSCVLYAAALLCKETAIVLPALVFAHEWIRGDAQSPADRPGMTTRLGRAIKPVLIYAPLAVIYLIARARILSGLGHSRSNASVSTWLITLPSILFFYVKHWFFPVRLSEFYDVFYQSRVNLTGVILPGIILAAMAAAVWIFRKQLGSRSAAYAGMWILIPLLPALDTFVFRPNELVHDRYFYVPSIGAALLTAMIIVRLADSRFAVFGEPAAVVGAALALTAVLGLCTVRESSFWTDDLSLYTRAHQIAPSNSTALIDLGAELLNRRDIDGAQAVLETAFRDYPPDNRVVYNLGRLSYIRKDYPRSEVYTKEAIRLDPNIAESFILLGQIELKQNRPVEATQSIRHAVELNPYDATYHTSYGIVLAMNRDCAGATTEFQSALALKPGDAVTLRELYRCRNALTPSSNSSTNSSQR
jgi:Flp pilus assembly protein TadD